jgi:integrase
MSIYKRGRFYHYEFQIDKRTYGGSTKETDERKARAVEKRKRKEAAEGIERAALERDTVQSVFARYWKAHGRHLSWADGVRGHMLGLETSLGADTPFEAVGNAELSAALEAYAAQEGRKNVNGTLRPGKPTPSTVNRRLAVFSGIYVKARDEWEIPVKPIVFRRHKRKEPRERVRHCTVAQAKVLLAALPLKARLVVAWSLATGCRRNETETLEWSRVNHETLQAEVQTKGGGTRFVDMSPAALNVLDQCDSYQRQPGRDSALVFDCSNLKKLWAAACKEAGLADFRFHDLRHTAATWVGTAGADITAIMKMLGHSRIETTMRYRHVLRADVKAAVAKSPVLIEGKVAPIKKDGTA